MKVWESALVEEISIAETQFGGNASMNFDNSWNDANGALHVQFNKETGLDS